MENLTTRVPNYTQIYFPYSTVMSACQGSGLACTRAVSIFATKTNHFTEVSEWNKYSESIATQLVYQHTPIDTAIYEKFACYNHKTKHTDWCPILNDSGWGIYLCMWKLDSE